MLEDSFDPHYNEIERIERCCPGYSDLLLHFHNVCETQLGATVDIETDEDPRSHKFTEILYANVPNLPSKKLTGEFNAFVSNGRTDFNNNPIGFMYYGVDLNPKLGDQALSVIPPFVVNHASASIQEIISEVTEFKYLEMLEGKVALVAMFEHRQQQLPGLKLIMDEQAFQYSLDNARFAAANIAAAMRKEGYATVPFSFAPSIILSLAIEQALASNRAKQAEFFFESASMSQATDQVSKKFLLFGFTQVAPPDKSGNLELSLVGAHVEENSYSTTNIVQQTHYVNISHQAGSMTVQTSSLQDYDEIPYSLDSG